MREYELDVCEFPAYSVGVVTDNDSEGVVGVYLGLVQFEEVRDLDELVEQ